MQILEEVITHKLFTLVTAPVAKGKTYAILNLYKNTQSQFVFVSPLRALADEIYQKLKDQKNIYYIHESKNDLKSDWESFLKKRKAFFVFTFETLSDELIDSLIESKLKILFVLDEFHLLYLWRDFRPIMHEKFLGILNSEMPIVALTATMNQLNMKELKNDLSYYQDSFVHLDFGNKELFYLPSKVHQLHGFDKKLLLRSFIINLRNKNEKEVFLLFAEFRSEVDQWVEITRRLGFQSIGCVGGEVSQFTKELSETVYEKRKLDCIIATSTLSHGVNLPEISKVFFSYQVNQDDFWLQMVGRGGRSGGRYEVYTFDGPRKKGPKAILERCSIYIFDWLGLPF